MKHEEWSKVLREHCKNRHVRLPDPRHLEVAGKPGSVTLRLSEQAVCRNLQHDTAAFEGWALALLTGGRAETIELDWQRPSDVRDRHYQRFLYRVDRFCKVEPRVRPRDRQFLDDLLLQPGGNFVVNVAAADSFSKPTKPEARLEEQVATADTPKNRWLKQEFGFKAIARQFPVGVFHGQKSRANAVFPHGSSAVDLVAQDRSGDFWLIELKCNDNRKVGAVSELFFYAMVLQDLRNGTLNWADTPSGRTVLRPEHLRKAGKLHALLLTEAGPNKPAAHPLIDDVLLATLSRAVGTIDFRMATLPCLP